MRVTRRFMEFADVSDINGLKALTQADILKAKEKLIKEAGVAADRLFGPVRDGRVAAGIQRPQLAAGA